MYISALSRRCHWYNWRLPGGFLLIGHFFRSHSNSLPLPLLFLLSLLLLIKISVAAPLLFRFASGSCSPSPLGLSLPSNTLFSSSLSGFFLSVPPSMAFGIYVGARQIALFFRTTTPFGCFYNYFFFFFFARNVLTAPRLVFSGSTAMPIFFGGANASVELITALGFFSLLLSSTKVCTSTSVGNSLSIANPNEIKEGCLRAETKLIS